MIISPKFKGFICITAHPDGCAENVLDQINYVKSQKKINGLHNVLVIGASAGYGLSSRIAATFAGGASTLGVIFDKPASGNRTATAGWYNTAAFEREANQAGFYAKSINGDAFTQEIKEETIEMIKRDLGKVDLVIYSIASPRRKDPLTGEVYTSVLKPLKEPFVSKTVDINHNTVSDVQIMPANDGDVEQTVKVMGGEDWMLWMKALKEAEVLSTGAKTIAYTYIGSDITKPIYRNGTIGKAKEHLEKTAIDLNEYLREVGASAYVSSNKALVTQSSSAIPVVTLYISLLLKIMKEKHLDENSVEQIYRLFSDKLYSASSVEAGKTLLRVDDYELRDEVQREVNHHWNKITSENVTQLTDIEGFKSEFLKLFGFGHSRVDYGNETEIYVDIPSISNTNETKITG